MRCSNCKKQITTEGINIRKDTSNLCDNCGTRLIYRHVLNGYWGGILLSFLPFYIFLLSDLGGVYFLVPSILGPVLTYVALYLFIKKVGYKVYASESDYERYKYPKEVLGAIIGFTSIFLWFFLGIELGQ